MLNDQEIDYDHKSLSLTLNLDMHTNHMQKNYDS